MSKPGDIWMPLYIRDFLADTPHLTAEQTGAYLLLLMHSWTLGPLPKDDAKLARMARVPIRTWNRSVRTEVMRFFDETELGFTQKRLETERLDTAHMVSQKSAAAKTRWLKEKERRDAAAHADADAVAYAEPYAAHASRISPSPSPSQKEERTEAKASDAVPASVVMPDDIRAKLWAHGIPAIRSLIGKSEAQAKAFLGKILKATGQDCARAYAIVREASDLQPVDPSAWMMAAASHRNGALEIIRSEGFGTSPEPEEPNQFLNFLEH